MSKKLIIFPFGGNAKEALMSIFDINSIRSEWDILGFIDENGSLQGKDCCGVKVLGGREILKKFPEAQVLAVPGNPDNYLKRADIIQGLGVLKSETFAQIIHPSVKISPDSKIGLNTLLMANIVVSASVNIGSHCVILPNTVISHDSRIGDYCCIGSNVTISGSVIIGDNCYIGSGSRLRDNIRVGKRSMIGIGSNVVSDIDEGVVAAGNPARIMRKVRP